MTMITSEDIKAAPVNGHSFTLHDYNLLSSISILYQNALLPSISIKLPFHSFIRIHHDISTTRSTL